jgi:hypothetical protein
VRNFLKNNHRGKKIGGVAQAAEHLLSKFKTLSSNPSTGKTNKQTNKKPKPQKQM